MNLFNPSFWLAVVLWTAAVAIPSYLKGFDVAETAAQLREAGITAAAKAEQHAEDLKTLEIERTARKELDERYAAYQEEKNREQIENDALIADLRADRRRLSIPVRRPACQASPGADPATAGGTGEEGRADLTPPAAEFLVGLATRGDDAIRKHAAVVDLYENARSACARQEPESNHTEK
jgi:hypothetical protein